MWTISLGSKSTQEDHQEALKREFCSPQGRPDSSIDKTISLPSKEKIKNM